MSPPLFVLVHSSSVCTAVEVHKQIASLPVSFSPLERKICKTVGPATQLTEDRPLYIQGK